MIETSKEEMAHECERLTEWINEGRFVTIFEAKRKTGFYDDTHYVKVCLISNDKGVWDMTANVSKLTGILCSAVYGKDGTLLWHGSIFDLMKKILYSLRLAGYTINVKTDDESAVNRTFRWV